MLVVEEKILVNPVYLPCGTERIIVTRHCSHREHSADGEHVGLGRPGCCGLPCGRSETVCPPVRICGTVNRQAFRVFAVHPVEELVDGRAPELRPSIVIVPSLYEFALVH